MNNIEHSPAKTTLLFLILLITLFTLPWPHGGEINWQYLPFVSFTLLLLCYFLLTQKSSLKPLNNIKTPLFFLFLWLSYSILQVIPMPFTFIETLSPQTLSHFKSIELINPNYNKMSANTISIYPYITIVDSLKNASYIAIFILMYLLLSSKKRVLQLSNVIFFSSAVIALYSIINYLTGGMIDFVSSIPPWTADWSKATHGTFSYQNHYASFLTLTIPLGFGLLYANIKNNKNITSTKFTLHKTVEIILSINAVYILSLIIMIMSLIKTASRGGNTVFIISIALTVLLLIFKTNNSYLHKLRKLSYISLAGASIIFILILSGITNTLSQRLDKQGYSPNGRDIMQQTAFSIIKDYPVFGSGAGTYPYLQHKYKSEKLGTTEMSKRAHNDYLELLCNQGIIGFLLLGIAISLLYIKIFKALNTIKGSLKGIHIACFTSINAILIHSLMDFNFQLPANTVYFYLLLALALKIPNIKKKI